MFKKKRDYGYYSSYGTSSRSRLKVGRVALVGAVGVVLVIGIVVVLNLTRIKLLIKGYSFSQASEILSLTKEQENEILSHDKLDHITNWIANSKKVSLYDVEIGDILVIKPGETVSIPGTIHKGVSAMSTYSNTSTYEPVVVKEGSHVRSGDVNVGDMPIYVQVDETYESSNYMNLMNIASVAPVYESKVEKYTKRLAQFYTPVMTILGLLLGIVLPLVNFEDYGAYIHVGAIFLVISGALSSDQATSLGMLAGFAKAFQNGIIVESSMGLDSVNAAQTIVYDRFDGVEVTNEELNLFKKLSHMGRTLVIYNDGPVALEDDQYMIYNNLTNEEKMEKMDSLTGPVVYIGDTFKDIELLQKSYVGISRGGLADPKVVENSDIVLIDANLNRVYETFVIARHMRTIAVMNNILTVVVKIAMLIVALSWTAIPLWIIVLIEILLKAFVMRNSTCIL